MPLGLMLWFQCHRQLQEDIKDQEETSTTNNEKNRRHLGIISSGLEGMRETATRGA